MFIQKRVVIKNISFRKKKKIEEKYIYIKMLLKNYV